MFERPHHQRIGQVLQALNGDLLRAHQCWFGGGTAMALRFGEYRESVDIDFLVSDLAGYRGLRQRLTQEGGIANLLHAAAPLEQSREVRADQYGIRTTLRVAGQAIKFEIVLEGRMTLERPSTKDEICGITTLTPLDMAAGKLLANSDRWADDGVFSRDLIDLAMMQASLPLLRRALAKSETAYGSAILRDLEKASTRLMNRAGWLERCMQAMDMKLPKALLWQRLRQLQKLLPR
jgi:hypothetical protein